MTCLERINYDKDSERGEDEYPQKINGLCHVSFPSSCQMWLRDNGPKQISWVHL